MFYKFKKLIKKFCRKNVKRFFKFKRIFREHLNRTQIYLKKQGFKNIQLFSLETWKYYGNKNVRFEYKAKRDSKQWIIKISKGFIEKSTNSLKIQKIFGEKFDFIPKGYSIIDEEYYYLITEYIPNYSYYSLKRNSKQLQYILNDFIRILKILDEYKIVHCDLVPGNFFFENKTNKVYLCDWDTCCCEKLNLKPDKFPPNNPKIRNENKEIYDDSYNILMFFNKFRSNEINSQLDEIEKNIGKNQHIEKI